MDEGTQGLYIFGAMTISFSLAWHWLVKSYKHAVIGSTVTTVILFQLATVMHIGYIDPFIPIGVLITGAITVIVAVVIGLPFKAHRAKSAN